MNRQIIGKDKIAAPNTPHSPGVIYGDLLYVSSQGSMDPKTGKIVSGSIEDEARLAINNVKAIVDAAGFFMHNAIKVNVYLADISDFDRFNKVYQEFFGTSLPARTVVQAKLAFGCKCEIEAIIGR